ncbi:S-adenosyl-L-methionine-dependent methyltransferase [Didymella exigua CBS 183.55]|uniref:S-adenosyl-L-methionine-dependent methyltransferase n=1 Tax=Didymella exigua CBS 183.55 TaxID=1150837 RepID=A0A6A5R5F9_9PLEO|nr:S-adenosyl-L-methionine-dependent methyltransferase [Didymella exigua CBS 183.55]KAF1922853.1 S-adenosyl-L-methionine-dependent methyltransferase [Didymella exigua CBS 183.55]
MFESTAAYEALTKHLAAKKYTFVCPSPETTGRVVEKRKSSSSTKHAQNAQDFFGWSLPCSRNTLRSIIPEDIVESLQNASLITNSEGEDEYRSTIRVSNFYLPNVPSPDAGAAPLFYIHSSFPASSDAVFFGPDTYLFTQFLKTAQRHLPKRLSSAIDVCCGSGAGAIHLAKTFPQAKVLGLDLNPRALRLGGVNAHLAGAQVDYYESNLYAAVPDENKKAGIDLIVSNPPYIATSPDGKDLPMYADGGAEFGLDISLKIVEEGMRILSKKGVIIVYTGVAVPAADPGHDMFLEKLQAVEGAQLVEYTILHPDMWPEEIGRGAYAGVGRIQVVGAVLTRS